MVKKGDTLIEVTLAVGIFSMVAIAIIAVLNGSISGAQTSLEATLAREEIDAQAEALRFIQSAYIADHGSSDENATSGQSDYTQLWRDITSRANDPGEDIVTYTPSSCSALYDSNGDVFAHRGFVINTRALGSNPRNALITAGDNANRFIQTPTYPHLVYGTDDTGRLIASGSSNNFLTANGLYIVAVRDDIQTNVVNENGEIASTSAFFDFYIRACWYGTDANEPSTISTVIRLYDPDAVQGAASGDSARMGAVQLYYYVNNSSNPITYTYRRKVRLESPGHFGVTKEGYVFAGYCTSPLVNGTCYSPILKADDMVENPDPDSEPSRIELYPIWEKLYTTNFYDADGTLLCSTYYGLEPTINLRKSCSKEPANRPTQVLQGWSPGTDVRNIDDSKIYQIGDSINLSNLPGLVSDKTLNLYPAWRTVVVFNGNEWSPSSNDYSESNCVVFNFNKPSAAASSSNKYCAIAQGESSCRYSYKQNGRTYSGTLRYGESYTPQYAPANGYLVSGGKHIETYSNGINLQGYCHNSGTVEVGVNYDIGKDDTFELSAKMDTKDLSTHPDGYANISIGPLTAQINSNNISSSCQSSSGSTYNFTAGTITLKLTKYNYKYSLSVNGTTLKTCTVTPTTNNIIVSYKMTHYGHYCNRVFNVQLTDIEMKRVIKD